MELFVEDERVVLTMICTLSMRTSRLERRSSFVVDVCRSLCPIFEDGGL